MSGWTDLHGQPLRPDKPPRERRIADQLFIGCLALILLAGVAGFLLLVVLSR